MQVSEVFAALTIEHKRLVREAWEAEPAIGYVFDLASRDQAYPGYDRAVDYERFKSAIRHMVGWDARNDAVASAAHYLACLGFIDALLSQSVAAPELEEVTR